MRIALADNNNLRFSGDLKRHWEKNGHEVRFEMGASENLAAWADLYFIDFWDNNIHYLYNWYQEHPDVRKPKFAVRAVDWEVWCGLARDQRIIDWVDVAICIAPHIERKLRSDNEWKNLHLIRCGVDVNKYQMSNKGGFNVVLPCNEIDWILKNVAEGIKIFGMLKKKTPELPWRLFIKGKWTQGNEYFKVLYKDLFQKLHIEQNVMIVDNHVENYDEFLEQMNFCLVPSFKEAYSYVTAECAAKGIKPILNNWYGADELWPKEWLYTTPDEAVSMFLHDYDPEQIREWVVENSNMDDMMKEYDRVLGL